MAAAVADGIMAGRVNPRAASHLLFGSSAAPPPVASVSSGAYPGVSMPPVALTTFSLPPWPEPVDFSSPLCQPIPESRGSPAQLTRHELTRSDSARDTYAGGDPGAGLMRPSCGATASTKSLSQYGGASVSSRQTSPLRWKADAKPPPKLSIPRTRMSDVLHGQSSQLRFPPSPSSQLRSPRSPGRGSPSRGMSPSGSPRSSLRDVPLQRASDECFHFLKRCQSDAKVEERVEDMIVDALDAVHHEDLQVGYRKRLEFRYAREQLGNPTYRNATKSATSLAGRSKIPRWR